MKLQNLNVTDPEFAERFEYFAFDEVVNDKEQELPVRTRWTAVLASLMGCGGKSALFSSLAARFRSASVEDCPIISSMSVI